MVGERVRNNPPRSGPPRQDRGLTKREIQILRLMAIGLRNEEIGAALSIKHGTVNIHVRHILFKFGVTSRKEAIRRALSGPLP